MDLKIINIIKYVKSDSDIRNILVWIEFSSDFLDIKILNFFGFLIVLIWIHYYVFRQDLVWFFGFEFFVPPSCNDRILILLNSLL